MASKEESVSLPVSWPVEYVLNVERPTSVLPARSSKYDRPESPSRARVMAERESRALSPSRSRVNADRNRDSKTASSHIDNNLLDHGGSELVPLIGSPRASAKSVSSPSHSTLTVKRAPFSSLFSAQSSSSKERRQKLFSSNEFSGLSEAFWWIWGGSGFSGIVCMTLSALAYGCMGFLVKRLTVHPVPSLETVFIRCGVIALASFIGLKRTGYTFEVSSTVRNLLVARAAVGYLALCGFLYSIHALPREDATVLNFTSLGVTAVAARVFLNENWAVRDMAGSLCNFLCVVLIMRPTFFLRGQSFEGKDMNLWVPVPTSFYYVLSVLVALTASVLGAASFCLLRAIGRSGEPPLVMVFAFAIFTCPASLLCMFIFQSFVIPGILQLLGMVVVSLIAFLAQVLLARGLQLEKVGRATSMLYLQVILLYFLEVDFSSKAPSIPGVIGVVVMTISTGFTTFWGSDKSADHAEV